MVSVRCKVQWNGRTQKSGHQTRDKAQRPSLTHIVLFAAASLQELADTDEKGDEDQGEDDGDDDDFHFCQQLTVHLLVHAVSCCNNNKDYITNTALSTRLYTLSLISHLIYPLTAKVVGAPQMILQPVPSTFLCSPLPSEIWRTPGLYIP